MSIVKEISQDNFDADVLGSDKPVLVDFWAEWCGPCKQLAPTISEIAQNNEGKLDVVKVDVDANRDLAVQYGIRSIPTLMIFNKGKYIKEYNGNRTSTDIIKYINSNLINKINDKQTKKKIIKNNKKTKKNKRKNNKK